MNAAFFLDSEGRSWLYIVLMYCLWVGILLMIKRLGIRIFRRISQQTQTQVDDVFVRAVDLPLTILIFASGGYHVERMAVVSSDPASPSYFLLSFKFFTLLAGIIFIDKFLVGILKLYAGRLEVIRSSQGIIKGVARFCIVGLGILLVLDNFGISITPLLASLGIGSLAVALALQPTLENLFSGIQLIADKPFQVGHFIKLDSGEEGHIQKIGWRSTWVLLKEDNMIVIPNKNLVNSKLTNYCYPQKELVLAVPVGVHYASNLDHVERVTVEVARQVLREVPGGVKNFEPFIRLLSLGDFSVNFVTILRAEEYAHSAVLRHSFLKALLKRYAAEGIVIPYPVQAVNYAQEKALRADDKD